MASNTVRNLEFNAAVFPDVFLFRFVRFRPHVDRTAEGDKVKARLVQQAICNSLRLTPTHATS